MENTSQTSLRKPIKENVMIKKKNKNRQKYKCANCDYSSLTKAALKSHILYKHTPEEQTDMHSCSQCLYKTKNKYNLKTHVRKMHKIAVLELDVKKEIIIDNSIVVEIRKEEESDKEVTEDVLHCTYCSYTTKIGRLLKQHVSHKHLQINTKYCIYCDFSTYTNCLLIKHILKQHPLEGLSLFKCNICTFKCVVQENLLRHVKLKHSIVLECIHCSFTTNCKRRLRLHLFEEHK